MDKPIPISELFRPVHIRELVLSDMNKKYLSRMLEAGWVENLLLYGGYGTGKTSTARLICDYLNADAFWVGDRWGNGTDCVKKQIVPFASSVSMSGSPKICVIDEAEQLTSQAQFALRTVIETSFENCRFIMTCNRIEKIDPALQSRMTKIGFDVEIRRRPTVAKALISTISRKLRKNALAFDPVELKRIVMNEKMDFRAMANEISRRAVM